LPGQGELFATISTGLTALAFKQDTGSEELPYSGNTFTEASLGPAITAVAPAMATMAKMYNIINVVFIVFSFT
jgi:hypothetical protein